MNRSLAPSLLNATEYSRTTQNSKGIFWFTQVRKTFFALFATSHSRWNTTWKSIRGSTQVKSLTSAVFQGAGRDSLSSPIWICIWKTMTTHGIIIECFRGELWWRAGIMTQSPWSSVWRSRLRNSKSSRSSGFLKIWRSPGSIPSGQWWGLEKVSSRFITRKTSMTISSSRDSLGIKLVSNHFSRYFNLKKWSKLKT